MGLQRTVFDTVGTSLNAFYFHYPPTADEACNTRSRAKFPLY